VNHPSSLARSFAETGAEAALQVEHAFSRFITSDEVDAASVLFDALFLSPSLLFYSIWLHTLDAATSGLPRYPSRADKGTKKSRRTKKKGIKDSLPLIPS
jgi:hypothetical protein